MNHQMIDIWGRGYIYIYFLYIKKISHQCFKIKGDTQLSVPMRIGAMCVQRFDDSRIQQFTLLIAFRCVLHPRENQDIRC